MAELTPYDTGLRLEPKVWPIIPPTHFNLPAMPADAQHSRYGKVDFEDDESGTRYTVWFEKQQGEYVMHVYCFDEEPPVIDWEGADK